MHLRTVIYIRLALLLWHPLLAVRTHDGSLHADDHMLYLSPRIPQLSLSVNLKFQAIRILRQVTLVSRHCGQPSEQDQNV
jgi:hypothetical protein